MQTLARQSRGRAGLQRLVPTITITLNYWYDVDFSNRIRTQTVNDFIHKPFDHTQRDSGSSRDRNRDVQGVAGYAPTAASRPPGAPLTDTRLLLGWNFDMKKHLLRT